MVVHTLVNKLQKAIGMIKAIDSIHQFKLWSQDVFQAYLQTSGELTRESHGRSRTWFCSSANQSTKTAKATIRFDWQRRLLVRQFEKHFDEYLKMTLLTRDLACFIKTDRIGPSGTVWTHVDDTECTCHKKFGEESKLAEQIFDPERNKYD